MKWVSDDFECPRKRYNEIVLNNQLGNSKEQSCYTQSKPVKPNHANKTALVLFRDGPAKNSGLQVDSQGTAAQMDIKTILRLML